MKKVMNFLIVFLMIAGMICQNDMQEVKAEEYQGFEYERWWYEGFGEESEYTIEITGYTGNETKLEIPSEINGEAVTAIGYGAFEDCENITSVVIPDGVIEIESSAFEDCAKLKEIALPKNIVKIESRTFSGCSNLESIVIPDGVIEIESNAFEDCAKLKEIALPASVKEIGTSAFDCDNIEKVTYGGNEEQWYQIMLYGTEISKHLTDLLGITYAHVIDDNGKLGIVGYNGNEEEVIIPSTLGGKDVTILGDYFNGSFKKVTISKDVEYIESGVLSSSPNLKEILVDENNPNYTSVDGVLYDKQKTKLLVCPKAKSGELVIPEGVISIGVDYDNDNKTEIENCENLTSIALPNSITTLPYSFYGDFYGCSSLERIVVSNTHPTYATDENGILYNKEKTLLIRCPQKKKGELVLPAGVTQIGAYAFADCADLTSIVLPESVTEFQFWWNTGTNGPVCSAFRNCVSLNCITIPVSIKKIEQYTFSSCANLKDVYYTGTQEQWNKIEIAENNIQLRQAAIHFGNQTTPEPSVNNQKDNKESTMTEIGDVQLTEKCVTYTGKALKPGIIVKDNLGNVVGSENYDVTYANNVKVGEANVKISFKGNYKGTVKRTFTIIPKGTKISKVYAKKKGFGIKWKKQTKQTDGYQIQYSVNKKFKSAKSMNIKKAKSISASVKKLKGNKKYYIRIRTYKKVKINGKSKKLYSLWSNPKTVKTKK